MPKNEPSPVAVTDLSPELVPALEPEGGLLVPPEFAPVVLELIENPQALHHPRPVTAAEAGLPKVLGTTDGLFGLPPPPAQIPEPPPELPTIAEIATMPASLQLMAELGAPPEAKFEAVSVALIDAVTRPTGFIPVRFLKHHEGYNAGEVAGFEKAVVEKLIAAGVAKLHEG